MTQKQCPYCNAQLPEDASFCPECGRSISITTPKAAQAEATACPRCHRLHQPPAPDHCLSCGYPLPGMANPSGSPRGEPPRRTIPGQPGSGSPPASPAEAGEPARRSPRPRSWPKISLPTLPSIAPRRWFYLAGGLVLLFVIGWAGIQFIKSRSDVISELPPCEPARVTEDYEEANRLDLEGNLRRDSYFKAGQDYIIAENATFTVPKGRTLIIEPGARVKFGQGAKMVVEGKLLACGKSSRQILFTANTASGTPGYWRGLVLSDADPDSVIGHASFEYAGYEYHAALYAEASDVHIEDLKFDLNAWYALSLDPNSYPQIRRPLLVENGPLGWEIRPGELITVKTWDNQQPYIVRELLTIAESGSLTIDPGGIVKFLPNGAINIKGTLNAVGTGKEPVRFTSYNDGGEDGAPEPVAGDWVGLRFYGRAARSRLEFVQLAYGGQGGYREVGCLWMEDANPQLVNVSISECNGFAISTDIGSDPLIEELSLSESDPLRRWQWRDSRLPEEASRALTVLKTQDGQALFPVVTDGWVGVPQSASLTIGPGTILLFAQGNHGLWSDGNLTLGEAGQEPVIFSSVRDPAFSKEGGAQPGDWSGFHMKFGSNAEKQVRNLEIRYGGAENIPCLRLESTAPLLEEITVVNCAASPVSSDAGSQPEVIDLDIQENDRSNTWEIWESTLAEAKTYTWEIITNRQGEQVVRLVAGVVTVETGATLQVSAGVIVKFNDGKGIKSKGVLQVDGTAQKPVIFTSYRDPVGGGDESGAQPGDWGGIVLEGSAGANLAKLEIRYAGNPGSKVGCLNFTQSQATLKDIVILSCGYYPVTSDLASEPSVDNLVLQDNQPANEWAIRESKLEASQQRQLDPIYQDGQPVMRTVTGWLSIEEGAGLTLSEEVVVKFAAGSGLRARGRLIARGSRNRPVVLTSWRDQDYSQGGGAQPGDWVGVSVEGARADAVLEYVQIRFAGGDQNPRGALVLRGVSPVLDNLAIQDSAWYPLSLDAQSKPNLQRLLLIRNTPGNAVEIRAEAIDSSGEYVWSSWEDIDGQPLARVVTGMLRVGEQAALRITPGVVVKFSDNGGLDVLGSLVIDQVVMTSFRDDEYGGDSDGPSGGQALWQGIRLHGRGLVQLQDSLIRFAQVGVGLEDAAPNLVDLRIADCWEAAMTSDAISSPVVRQLGLENNAINGMLLTVDRLPDGGLRWGVLGEPENQLVRVVKSILTIGPSSQLAVDPGVIIKFAPQAGLVIEGQASLGNSGSEVSYLTSLADDSNGGNTDNINQPPIRGSWQGLRLNPNNTQVILALNNLAIQYALTGLEVINPLTWQVKELTIAESQQYGISCASAFDLSMLASEISFLNNLVDFGGCVFVPEATPTPEFPFLTPSPGVTPTP